jgi:hypothetical protein
MSNQKLYRLAIVLVVAMLLGLACGACASTTEPTQPPPVEATTPPEVPPTEAPPTEIPPTEIPPTEVPPPPPEPSDPDAPEPPTVEPTPCPEVKCLPNCFANNLATVGGDGTEASPWRGSAADKHFFEDIECAAQEQGVIPSSLSVIYCGADSQTCSEVLYTYGSDGQWTSTELAPAPPTPQPGVPLPFALVLVGVAVLGITLLGAGILLRFRARTLRS